MNNRNLDVIDIISVLSFIIGYANLMENREQSAQNDVSAANEKQANFLLDELSIRFEQIENKLNLILEGLKNDNK